MTDRSSCADCRPDQTALGHTAHYPGPGDSPRWWGRPPQFCWADRCTPPPPPPACPPDRAPCWWGSSRRSYTLGWSRAGRELKGQLYRQPGLASHLTCLHISGMELGLGFADSEGKSEYPHCLWSPDKLFYFHRLLLSRTFNPALHDVDRLLLLKDEAEGAGRLSASTHNLSIKIVDLNQNPLQAPQYGGKHK